EPPSVGYGRPWVDPDFRMTDAIQGSLYAEAVRNRLEWKRPQEFRRNPVLYTDGRSRFDVGQGRLGTCWFLATVSSIADKPHLLDKVIPPNAYSPRDGTFHARFWHFGQWEDVYIDDYLPVIYGDQIWGAHSADRDEMWISLLEKAFAKNHGSYNAVEGGTAVDAFPALTGGVSESVDHKDVTNRDEFYVRINNAVMSGCYVISSVPLRNDDMYGLVGGHAYAMTGLAKVRGERLLRVRNPWGTEKEWTGRWSDKSREWDGIPQSEVPHSDRADGEFWISFDDFWRFFTETTICSLTPDFDKDGVTDTLNYVLNIYGQWIGDNAVGYKNKMGNPKYAFTLPDMGEDTPVVVQLIQRRKDRKDPKNFIWCDLLEVRGSDGRRAVVEFLPPGAKNTSYRDSSQRSFRFRLRGGNYCVIPTTHQAGQEREFLIRVFSPVPLQDVREMGQSMKVMSCDPKPSINYNRQDHQLSFCRVEFGSWRMGVNAGGQTTRHINPQYQITITQREAPLVILSLQDASRPLPVGYQLFLVDQGERIPMSEEQINQRLRSGSKTIPTIDGNTFKFIRGPYFDATYLLPGGHYLLLVHSDENMEGDFTLVFKSTAEVGIRQCCYKHVAEVSPVKQCWMDSTKCYWTGQKREGFGKAGSFLSQ
ncbi:hypothetical protein BaRGS_00004302, partial [Batillaria attramentaria]